MPEIKLAHVFVFVVGIIAGIFLTFDFLIPQIGHEVIKTRTDSRIFVEVVAVYDGDTFRCNIPGWPDIIGKNIPIRLKRLDAPEMRGPEKVKGLVSKNFVIKKLNASRDVELRDISRDKYFRIDAEVYVDGRSLNQMLIDNGLAEKVNWK